METRIYISNKIKKTYKNLSLNQSPETADMENHKNSWNANYTNVLGKKCWVLTHSHTRYTVIMPDVKARDTKQFLNYFIDSMINQLSKKFIVDRKKIHGFLREISFYPTNNDRSCIAYNNKRIEDIEYRKYEFDEFEKIPFEMIGSYINELGSILRNGKSVFIYPTTEMLELINSTT